MKKGGHLMNPKVKKLRAEREKNCEKIAKLKARNEEIDQEVTNLENTDIIGLVRGVGMTPDQLAALIQGISPHTPTAPAGHAGPAEQEGPPHEKA